MDSSNSTYLFMLHPDVEFRTFGFAYAIFAFFTFPIFFIVIKTVYLKDKETPNITYKLMNIINCTQLTQAISHFLTSPALIFPNIMHHYGFIINVVGCTFNTLWIADFPMITLLAVSRILIFTNRIGTQKFPLFMKICIITSWSWFAFVWIYGSISQNLIFVSPGWDYDFNVPLGRFFSDHEIAVSIICLVVSYFSYIYMAFLIFKRKSLKSSVNSRANEIAILIQSTFVTAYISGIVFAWHQALLSMFAFVDMENKTNQALVDCALILHCYVNPTTMLLCNKSIRQSCLKRFRLQSSFLMTSLNSSSVFVLNPDVEMRFFGFAYCTVAIFLPPLFFIVIRAVYLKDRETPNMAFKLMNVINCSQLTQAITHFLTGPGLIFPNILDHYGFVVNRKSMMSCVNSRKNEIAILLQSTFVTTYITAMIFVWHQALFSMVSFIDMESKRNQAILNCCLIFHCYVNPTMALICNKSIRHSCYKMLGIRKKLFITSRTENTSKLSSINPTVTNAT